MFPPEPIQQDSSNGGEQASILVHSGWVLDDYVNDAKRKFMKFGKGFKHEMVYIVLKKSFPKYEFNMSAIDSWVRRALFSVTMTMRFHLLTEKVEMLLLLLQQGERYLE